MKMGRAILLLILFFSLGNILGQESVNTIEVSRKFKTIMIFPEAISESIIGNEFGFVVDLPKEGGSKYNNRILKLYYDDLATEKENSTNHTVITSSGDVYDFILKLVDKPSRMTWHINKLMSNANIQNHFTENNVTQSSKMETEFHVVSDHSENQTNINLDTLSIPTDQLYKKNPGEYFRLRSYYMQFDKARIPREFVRSDGVFLWLKGVYYNKNEIYLQFKIENKETVDFDVNFLKCSIESAYKNTKAQKLPLNPGNELLLSYKVPKRVQGKSENHFVLVLKKFTLDNKKRFLLELDEKDGNRHLSFRIDHNTINNPIPFE